MMIAVIWSCRGILDQLAFNFLFLSFSLVFEKRKGKIYLYLLYISIERERDLDKREGCLKPGKVGSIFI
jgi:hypothetical protein